MGITWLASLWIVNPLGNFPLNDDWSFGLAVRTLLQDHTFHPTAWTAMPLLTNVLWGGLFCLPCGFSFTALRLSTLAASGCGIFGLYYLARQSPLPSWLAGLVTLTLTFNPIYYALSNTFMTDVLFTVLSIGAAIGFMRYLKDGADSALFLGTLFAVLATLSRQLALALPVAFAISSLLKRGLQARDWVRAILPAVAAGGALLAFQYWMAAAGRLPADFGERTEDLIGAVTHPGRTIPKLVGNIYISLLYLGFFLSPVLLVAMTALWKNQRKKVLPVFAAALWVLLLGDVFYRARGIFLPLSKNILVDQGIGPMTLRDAYLLHCNIPPSLPAFFWKFATGLGLFGAASLIALVGVMVINLVPVVKAATLSAADRRVLFLLLTVAIYLSPLLTTDFFDRYLMPAIPFLAVALISAFQPSPTFNLKVVGIATVFLIASLLLAVCGTRDYLTWNRLRWQAANDLMASRHLTAEHIDGGFEFNGWYFYLDQPISQHTGKNTNKSWWWVHDDTYLITFGPVTGYKTVNVYPYHHWLPPYTGKIFVLQKVPDQSPKP